MKILSIETSCDETAIAILECEGGLENPHFKEISSKVLSQIDIHKEYGGVFPALAKREHSRNLVPTLLSVLKQDFRNHKSQETNSKQITKSKLQKIKQILNREPELLEQFLKFIPQIEKPEVDAIAVTQGPGLEPALWVGINFAKALSLVWSASRRMPIIPVNHMEGHIASVLPLQNGGISNPQFSIFKKIQFPAIALLISGGHTELVLVKKWGEYEIVGETQDDAVGEAFDKVARMLELPYPGGPQISRLANQSRNKSEAPNPKSETIRQLADKIQNSKPEIKFPRPMINSADLNFSFSGLKTAVLYHLKENLAETLEQKQEVAREFEDAVVEVLTKKTEKALKIYGAKSLILGGGVVANKKIRETMEDLKEKYPEIEVYIAPQKLSTDNAVMIGMAGYIQVLKNKNLLEKDNSKIVALGNMRLGSD